MGTPLQAGNTTQEEIVRTFVDWLYELAPDHQAMTREKFLAAWEAWDGTGIEGEPEDEPDIDDWTPPDFGPPGSGAVIIEYTGFEPGLEDPY